MDTKEGSVREPTTLGGLFEEGGGTGVSVTDGLSLQVFGPGGPEFLFVETFEIGVSPVSN